MGEITSEARSHLERAATDGFIEQARWHFILDQILTLADHVIRTRFPIPKPLPPQNSRVTPLNSEEIPSSPPEGARVSEPSLQEPNSSSGNAVAQDLDLPAPLQLHFEAFKKQLSTQFATHPPHTLQRLAELILYPRKHYRYLPSFLNALDKTVTVSSGSNVFPLPNIDHAATTAANGMNSAPSGNGLTDDESVGGALLTPIPWLRANSMSSTSNLSSSSPTASAEGDTTGDTDSMREHGGITQGELLRQEQQNSNPPAPVASLASRHLTNVEGALVETEAQIDESEQPHARGPEEIADEDIGPQERQAGSTHTLNIAAAVGRMPNGAGKVSNNDVGMSGVDTSNGSTDNNDSSDIDSDGIDVAQADAILAREKRDQKQDEDEERA